jgi:Ssp1 endopeptidase immunity protein Rap1a
VTRAAAPRERTCGRPGASAHAVAGGLAVVVLAASTAVAAPAAAASFGELQSWCAPAERGGRPLLCAAYLDADLERLVPAARTAGGGTAACVPADADRGRIVALVEDYARRHPSSRRLSDTAGLGLALKDRFPCR